MKKTLILSLVLSYLMFYPAVYAQNLRADGYRGLWSASLISPEHGYRYSGGLATSFPHHNPMAIYSSRAGKTFFVYGGTSSENKSHLQIMVSFFDHKTRMVPKPVIVFDKDGVNDAQDNASISIDSDGFIYVFVSGQGRTRPGCIFKSESPYSIGKFELLKEGEIIYPQPWWVSDSCFLMLHAKFIKGGELFWTTSKDGKKWSESHKLAAMGGNRQLSGSRGNSVFTIFNYFKGGSRDGQTNLYLLKSENAGKTWKTIDNKEVQLPLTNSRNEALVRDYESENKLVYIKDLNFDRFGEPVILLLISNDFRPGPAGDPREWFVVHRKADKWVFSKVCQSDNNHDMGSVYIKGTEWRIIGTTEAGSRKYTMGGEIAMWISNDEGLSWKKEVETTSHSTLNNSFARRPVNADGRFYAFWSDGDPDSLSACRLYFTDESCKKVWILPYNMSGEMQRPARLKR